MNQDTAVIERRIAEQRAELASTLAALAYQANLKHRLPEYVEDAVETAKVRIGERAKSAAADVLERVAGSTRQLAHAPKRVSTTIANVLAPLSKPVLAPLAVVPVALAVALVVSRRSS